MSDTYDTYEDWEDEAKDSPLALVGIVVMGLTSAAIAGNALFMQPKSAKIEMMERAVKKNADVRTTSGIQSSHRNPIQNDRTALILAVQRQLTMAGYYVGPLDGMEGAQTREAVLAYQDANGMVATGRVNMALYDILTGRKVARDISTNSVTIQKNQTKPSVVNAMPVIAALPKRKPRNLGTKRVQAPRLSVALPAERGRTQVASGPVPPAPIPAIDPDPILAKVQSALNKYGQGGLTVDGLMGSRTSSAIAEFQRRRGHPVTGKVNDRLLQELMVMGYLDLG